MFKIIPKMSWLPRVELLIWNFPTPELNSALDFLGFPTGMTLISQQIKNFLVLKKKLHRSKNKSFESEVDRVVACYNGFQGWQLLLQSTESDLAFEDPKRGRNMWILKVKKRWKTSGSMCVQEFEHLIPNDLCIFEVTFTVMRCTTSTLSGTLRWLMTHGPPMDSKWAARADPASGKDH